MKSDGNYSGLLLGHDPSQDEEQKTQAQLDDERQPSVMQHAKSAYDDEDDDAPAIEQRIEHKGVIVSGATHASSKPKLEASSAFAEEMHQRQAAEKAAREKKQQEEEAKAAEAAAKREKELEQKLVEAQELDDETIREGFKQQVFEENQEKLYPDARPVTSEVEDELWKRRAEEGQQIAGRAKLGDVYDDELSKAIIIASAFGGVGLLFTLIGIITGSGQIWLERTFIIIGIVAFIAAISWLTYSANRAKHHAVPSNLANQFKLATAIPGVIFRIPFITAARMIPIAGPFVGPFIGCAIAASIHYTYINHYDVYVSILDTLISEAIFAVLYIAIYFSSPSSAGDGAASTALTFGFTLIGYLLGDILSMKIAEKSKK